MMRVVFIVCVICAGSCYSGSPPSRGQGDFIINQRSSQDQKSSAVAVDSDGGFVVVWNSYGQDGSSGGIYGRRFGSDGEAVGDEFGVNVSTIGNQSEPGIAMDSGGGFVVVWHGPGSVPDANEDVFGRWFDVNGVGGSEVRINNVTGDRQLYPSVSMRGDGRCVVVWESIDAGTGERGICGRIFDVGGAALGTEFVVSDNGLVCRYPAVAMREDGRFVALWVKDTTTNSLWERSFQADGTSAYLSSEVNDGLNFSSLTRAQISMDAVGNYVIVWDEHAETYLEDDVFLKRYHWSGAPMHDQYLVHSEPNGAQSDPWVSMNDEGEYVVVWQSDAGATGSEIMGQRFAAMGDITGYPDLIGGEFRVNHYVAGRQRYAGVGMGANGFVTVWESYGQDGSGYGVFGMIGPLVGSGDFDGDGFVGFGDYSVLAEQWRSSGDGLVADVIDDGVVNELDLRGFFGQWLEYGCECGQADLDGDGVVNLKDYAVWAGQFTDQGRGLVGDVTGDGVVGFADLGMLGIWWTMGCE